ncbi:hypothetical protein [Helicobacter sp. 10-6591]|uniref:hypothetical protein n=1 Tax=Helicobacter sp. 10-6591 TaxID=2004998 RepID=UPI000DCDEBCC|nr:hypothetical protein [Helicobacter sp. 10-6591]MCI7484340.1 hypothetical protein [Helicobacter sp.]RAX55466.1 hypothetical protein CCY97_04160 [Helicobacter sp. 10-6591]
MLDEIMQRVRILTNRNLESSAQSGKNLKDSELFEYEALVLPDSKGNFEVTAFLENGKWQGNLKAEDIASLEFIES